VVCSTKAQTGSSYSQLRSSSDTGERGRETEDTCIGLWDRVSLSGISDTILIHRGEGFWVPCNSLNVGSCSLFDVHACWMKSPKVVAGILCPSGLRILGMWCSCSMKLTISVLRFSGLSHRNVLFQAASWSFYYMKIAKSASLSRKVSRDTANRCNNENDLAHSSNSDSIIFSASITTADSPPKATSSFPISSSDSSDSSSTKVPSRSE
jgi:hypothetical protein